MSTKKTYITTVKPFEFSQKEKLGEKWLELEKDSDCSVFLSWLWIGNWLDVVTINYSLLKHAVMAKWSA